MARVLIIEDSPLIVQMLTMICEGAGHQVQSCTSFSLVEDALSSFQPELIITDLNLPDLSEANAALALRKIPAAEKIPLIIISGQPRDALLQIAQTCGAQDALSKDAGMPQISAQLPPMIDALI